MAYTIDEMRAKMNSIAAGTPMPVVKLEETTSASVSGSASVEALRNKLMGKLVAPSQPLPETTTSQQEPSRTRSHQELLEEVLNNQIRAVKEDDVERDKLRESVGVSRLDLIGSIL